MAEKSTEKTQQSAGVKSAPAATSSAKTSTARSTSTGATATVTATTVGTTSPNATGVPSTPVASASTAPTIQPPLPASPRNGVAVNVATVAAAFRTGGKARSVRFIQFALRERGFAAGNEVGLADHATRAAYAKFQRSVGERATGLPTADSLDLLGFDVVG